MRVFNIKWNVAEKLTGEELERAEKVGEINLPHELILPAAIFPDEKYANPDGYEELLDDVSEWLSDTFGFCHDGFQLTDLPKYTAAVTVYDKAVYYIEASIDQQDKVEEVASEWFAERAPSIDIQKTEKKAEYSL